MMTKQFMRSVAFIAFLSAVIPALAQNDPADQILGKWLNEDKDAHVEVYKEAGKYFGKIVWLKEPNEELTGLPKLDDENSDVTLQSRPVMGLVILKDFVYDGDGEWEDGTIYDPKNGKTYDCYMEFDEEGVLKIRGYIGISWIGRSSYWTRVN
jgi:uncharacterized protein (DUF2147 family)